MQYIMSMMIMAVGAGPLLMGAHPEPQAAEYGKPQAPVKIQGSMGPSSGSVVITFTKPGKLVDVQVYGTDGLVVSGNKMRVSNGTFDAGKTMELKLDYTPGAPHGNVAVVVSGQFGGSRSSRTASFTVGEKTPSKSHANVTTDKKGERIVILPAERK